jgi:deoxyuridine 5'-triphosphate nucleotidohydrolase
VNIQNVDRESPSGAYALGLCLGAPGIAFSSWSPDDQRHLVQSLEAALGDAEAQNALELLRSDSAALSAIAQISALSLPQVTALHAARGYFDAISECSIDERGNSFLHLTHSTEQAANWFADTVGHELAAGRILRGVQALDLFGTLYSDQPSPARPCRAETFRAWCSSIAALTRATLAPEIQVQRLVEEAVLPSKERVSDSGYDLTLLAARKVFGNVTLFGTGLIVEPPEGWYLDVVPRSSIIKRGYILANSVGIIDRSYRGELMVPLIKLDTDAPDLELPARVAQIIPRPIVHFAVREHGSLTATARGTGGFGSTGR